MNKRVFPLLNELHIGSLQHSFSRNALVKRSMVIIVLTEIVTFKSEHLFTVS